MMMLIIAIYTLSKLCKKQPPSPKPSIRPLFRNLTIVSLLAFCMTGIADIGHMYIHMMSPHSFANPIEPYIAGLADAVYYIGSISFYSLLLYRIYFIFQETELQLSKLTLWLMCI